MLRGSRRDLRSASLEAIRERSHRAPRELRVGAHPVARVPCAPRGPGGDRQVLAKSPHRLAPTEAMTVSHGGARVGSGHARAGGVREAIRVVCGVRSGVGDPRWARQETEERHSAIERRAGDRRCRSCEPSNSAMQPSSGASTVRAHSNAAGRRLRRGDGISRVGAQSCTRPRRSRLIAWPLDGAISQRGKKGAGGEDV